VSLARESKHSTYFSQTPGAASTEDMEIFWLTRKGQIRRPKELLLGAEVELVHIPERGGEQVQRATVVAIGHSLVEAELVPDETRFVIEDAEGNRQRKSYADHGMLPYDSGLWNIVNYVRMPQESEE
jgi:hypothetical protein